MKKHLSFVVVFILILNFFNITISANNSKFGERVSVFGKKYSFETDNDYAFSESTSFDSTETSDTYGSFQIVGKDSPLIDKGTKDGVPSFALESGNIEIFYTYTDRLQLAPQEEMHLDSDGTDRIDSLKLDNDIKKGALVLQRSIDHRNWNSVVIQTNAFEDTPNQDKSIYTTLDVELINGCYYRLIVAYKTENKGNPKKIFGVIPKDTYSYQRHAEVYEFYATLDNNHIESSEPNTNRFRLGDAVKVADGDNYSGEEEIESNDLHYGWELGQFFVNGYTQKERDENGDPVFLKNPGDVVTLWFNLEQDIDALNGDKDISIAFDEEGSDQYFQMQNTVFGRGMLIIRQTDYENVKHEPVLYYDYLEANTSFGADTRVNLFEEGDYEVALDYEVKKNGFAFLGSTEHYRNFFKFSVRNANCMVYPFDVKTGAELTNSSMTENGFYLDLARSRYLTIFIKKEVWTEGADGLTQDTRFNTIAKDGDRYTDEGIYTITVKNQYTNQETPKRIYVGKNPILKAYMTSNYSIQEIVQLVDAGATIYEDGTIELPSDEPASEVEAPTGTDVSTESAPTNQTESTAIETNEVSEETEPTSSENGGLINDSVSHIGRTGILIGTVVIVAIIGVCVGLAIQKRRSRGGTK